MKRLFVTSYSIAMGAATRMKHSMTAIYNNMMAFCSQAKQWAKTIGFWIPVLVITAPTVLLPHYVDCCLTTISKRYSPHFGDYKAGMSPYVAKLGTASGYYYSLYLVTLSIGLLLIRALTRLVQKRSKANLNLCSSTTGPGCRGIRCGVCWGDMDADDDTMLHGPCQHSLHLACIEEIAKFEQGSKGYAPCPVCRKPMNQESKIGGLLRSLPSWVNLREDRLERLSSLVCQVNMIFATISLGVFLARSQSREGQQRHPALLIVVPPTNVTIAVFVAATALAFEQLLLLKRFILLRPVFARMIINVGFLMVLMTAGCQIEMPATLTVNQFANVAKAGLRRGYARYSNAPTVNWWVWVGQSYIFYSSVASAGLVGALIIATGAGEFQYE